MTRILALTLIIFALLLCPINFTVTGRSEPSQTPTRPMTPQEHEAWMLKAMQINISSAAKILEEDKVAIEAQLLFTHEGRKKLRPQLEKMPEMQSAKFHSGPVRGVLMADTLTLAENLEVEADTVIIARQIIFNGTAPVLKGPHDIHVFALNSITAVRGVDIVITIATTSEGVNYLPASAKSSIRVENATVTIDTSGADGEAGSPARADAEAEPVPTAKAGESGVKGAEGKPGACARNNAAEVGGRGSDGLSGEDGGNGTKGKNGPDAHNLTIAIPNTDSPYFRLLTRGGDGGSGGNGGPGGRGGDGGFGADGIGCQCIAGGVGAGGAGGNGGSGGIGGKGGDGGDGGNAGHLVIFHPLRNYDLSRLKSFGGSGRGGRGGIGGRGGMGGAPGKGGSAGHLANCDASNVAPGAHGNRGEPGRWGSSGDWGRHGEPGSLGIFQIAPLSGTL